MTLHALVCNAALLSGALALSACSPSTDVEQGDEIVEDGFGCPALGGSYAVQMPNTETGVKLEGSPLEGIGPPSDDYVPLQAMSGVIVEHDESGGLSFRFLISDEWVMEELETIREYRAPQYDQWYKMQQHPARGEYVTRFGEDAYQKRVAELGPRTTVTLSLQRGKDFTCDDGWLEIPREYREPIRLTLGEDGNLVARSREVSTYGLGVYAGSPDLQIPTGTYTGTMVWPRAPGLRPWTADGMAGRFIFLRPVKDYQAAEARFAANTAASNARRYASFDQIRERFAAIAPDGVQVLDVGFVGNRVRVKAGFPDAVRPDEDQRARIAWMIAAVEESHPRFLDGKEVVERGVMSDGKIRHEVDFTLFDGPLVLAGESGGQTDTAAAAVSGSPFTAAESAQTTVVLPPSPLVPSAIAEQAVSEPEPAAPGMASTSLLGKRLAAYLAGGCSITSLRNSGDRVFVVGSAPSLGAVSDSLRALDSAAAPVSNSAELVSIEQQGPAYRFEIMLRRSALTAE